MSPRRALALWLFVVVVAAAAFSLPQYGVPPLEPGFNPTPISIMNGMELVQSFRVRAQPLRRIDIVVTGIEGDGSVDVELLQRQGSGLVPLQRSRVPLASFKEGGSFSMVVDAVVPDPLTEYAVRLRVVETAAPVQLTLQMAEGHEYSAGSLWRNGEAVAGDLVMRVDADTARPWNALSARLYASTGIPGLEWVFAVWFALSTGALLRHAVKA